MKSIHLLLFVIVASCAEAVTPNAGLCTTPSIEPLTTLDGLGGILFEENDIYWTEQTGLIKKFTKSTKQVETLKDSNASPLQLCKQGKSLIWYQNSTTYEAPNQLIRLDLTTNQDQTITPDYLAKDPQLICQQDKLYFINRGRKLMEESTAGLRELLRISGAPVELQTSGPYLYLLQREFRRLTYSHRSLLQIDPLTNAIKTLLGPPLSPLYFALQGEILYASVYQAEENDYALLKVTPSKREELMRSESPLSTLIADESSLYFTQEEPDGYTIYQFDLKQQRLVPWVTGLSYLPTHLSLDAEFLYWVGLHQQQPWLLRILRR
jgi:hypothetical protein